MASSTFRTFEEAILRVSIRLENNLLRLIAVPELLNKFEVASKYDPSSARNFSTLSSEVNTAASIEASSSRLEMTTPAMLTV